MAENRQSLSEQSQHRGNRILLIIGLCLCLVFVLAWCRMRPEAEPDVVVAPPSYVFPEQKWGETGRTPGESFKVEPGQGQLLSNPAALSIETVIGKQSEATITLKADKNAILIQSKGLEQIDKNLSLSGTCMENGKDQLALNEECTVVISWNADKSIEIKDSLVVQWREDDDRRFKYEKLIVPIQIKVTDSNPCVICKCAETCQKNDTVPRQAATLDGTPAEEKEGKIKVGEDEFTIPDSGVVIDPKTKKIVAIAEPKRIPLNLKNELIGTISDNLDVLDFKGEKIGRLLGDLTIVDPELNVIGRAIEMVPAMDDTGVVLGRMKVDDANRTVVIEDAKGKILGYPRVDGQVITPDGQPFAFLAPWGLVINFKGEVLGGIVPTVDSSTKKYMLGVMNEKQQILGYMRPQGLAVSKKGMLIGGVVPSGVVVGAGCNTYGSVTMTGQVFDAYNQNIGHVLLDKSVLDSQNNELGSVVRQGLVIDAKGKVVGFVNSAGKAVNDKGVIGCVNPDGGVFAQDKFVGSIMPLGRVIKDMCGQVGSVYPNGQVMSLDLQTLGHVLPDSVAVGDKNQTLGMVAPWGTAIAPDCQLLGLISLNGNVVSVDGSVVGCITRDKQIQNMKGDLIGMVTPFGVMINDQNQVIGRVGLDGHLLNANGEVEGCVNASKNPPPVALNSTRGVVIDENGHAMGWSFVAGKVYDSAGKWMGDINSNGWVIGEKKQLVGVVPFSGSVFSDKGEIVGRYNQMSGLVTDVRGETVGRVLPGMTVVNLNGAEILGKLIPENTVYADMAGKVLGTLQSDGTLMNLGQVVPGKILANGSFVDAKGGLLGARLYTGPVLDSAGKYIGSATQNGDFLNEAGLKIGRSLSNRLVVSEQKTVLGMVFPGLSTAVSVEGWLGSLNPQLVGDGDKLSYQGQVSDVKGNLVGKISSSGDVLGLDHDIKGNIVPIDPYVTPEGRLLGWGSFHGQVNGPDGRSIGSILPSGLTLNSAQQIQGMVVRSLPVVGTQGEYLGHTTAKGELRSASGEILAIVGLSSFVYDSQGILLGQVLPPGIALNFDGKLIGWTRYDGQIENGSDLIGQVGLDGHIFDENGQMIGMYAPLGKAAYSETGKTIGLISESGDVQDTEAVRVAHLGSMPFVASKTLLTGRLENSSPFVAPLNVGRGTGIMAASGEVYPLTSAKSSSLAMLNTLTSGEVGLIDGGILPLGLAVSSTLGLLGRVYPDGTVYNGQKLIATVTGTGLIYSISGELLGGISAPDVIIDKKGAVAGRTGGVSGIFDKGKQIGNKMAFSSALTTSNQWIGNSMPKGSIVDDKGQTLGVILSDGSVVKDENQFVGRVLPDGSMAGVAQKTIYNTMPYSGHTVAQGLPLGLMKKDVMGRTTVMGSVIDRKDNQIHRILDSGYILGKNYPIEGVVLPFISAIAQDGSVLGTVSADGKIVSYEGETMGTLTNNATVKGSKELEILGRLVPEPLIVNDCKVVGQTAYDGKVINGQGSVVGHIRVDGWAIDAQGNPIGRYVKDGPVNSPEGEYIGRTLPDSTVVDINGVEIACATNTGEVIDKTTGENIGSVISRGPVFNEKGEMIGFVDSTGRVIGKNGEVIGLVLGDGKNTVVNLKGERIGWALDRDAEVIFDPDTGRVKYTLTPDGENIIVRGANNETLFIVKPDGIYDPYGNRLAPNNGTLPSLAVCEGVGQLKDCEFFDFEGNKLASLMPDGKLLDENGNLYAFVSPTGSMTAPNGTAMCDLKGIDIDLQQCGLSEGKGSTRGVMIGGRAYKVLDDGSIVDDDNMQIGYTGDGGILFGLDGNPIDTTTQSGRPKPPKQEPLHINPEDLEPIQKKLAQKRQSMREGLGGEPLTMSAEMKARFKPKKDKDWASLGIEKSTSSWPVDMSRVILQGRAISAVLARSIDSRFTDSPVVAIVDTNIYAEEGRNILIPAGSQLIGGFAGSSDGVNGNAKVDIVWNRLVRPDGVAFNLDSTSGDAMGRSGISAYLDEQLLKKYGGLLGAAAIANSFISTENELFGTGEVLTAQQQSGNYTASEDALTRLEMRENWKEAFDEIQDDLVSRMKKIQPVLYVPIGTRLTVLLNQDLWLRSLDDDEAEADEEFGQQSPAAKKPNINSWTATRKNSRPKEATIKTEKVSPQKEQQKQKQMEQEMMETPLYDGSDHMVDEVVSPVQAQSAM